MKKKSNKNIKVKKKYFYFFIKRILDIIFAIIGILFFFLVWLIVKLCYLFSKDAKYVIYVHRRVGKNGKLFNMYKFRTMTNEKDKNCSDRHESVQPLPGDHQKHLQAIGAV